MLRKGHGLQVKAKFVSVGKIFFDKQPELDICYEWHHPACEHYKFSPSFMLPVNFCTFWRKQLDSAANGCNIRCIKLNFVQFFSGTLCMSNFLRNHRGMSILVLEAYSAQVCTLHKCRIAKLDGIQQWKMLRWGSLTVRPSQTEVTIMHWYAYGKYRNNVNGRLCFGTRAKINDKQNTDDMRTGTVFLCLADNSHNISQLPKLCKRIEYWRIEYLIFILSVRSFSTRLPSVIFTE